MSHLLPPSFHFHLHLHLHLRKSKSPFASRQSLCLVSNVFPQSKSQPHRITNKPNPPPISSNFFSKGQPQWKERRGCGKADAISGQDGEAGEEGCVPNVIFYNKHLNGLCKKGVIKKALYVLNIMISKGPIALLYVRCARRAKLTRHWVFYIS